MEVLVLEKWLNVFFCFFIEYSYKFWDMCYNVSFKDEEKEEVLVWMDFFYLFIESYIYFVLGILDMILK